MNRDEALRSFDIGKEYLRKNDLDNAIKFFIKSYKLDPSEITKSYIEKCKRMQNSGSESSSSSTPQPNTRTNQQSASSSGTTTTETPKTDNGNFTQEQINDVKKIIKTKDFYEVLGIPKTATDDEIKKSYRKLALKYHPDKNKVPQADEAFKKLAQAYDCLSNPDKRKVYDQYGSEDPDTHYQHYRQYYNTEDIHPEDIFEMFFGMNNAFGPRMRRGGRAYYYRYDNSQDNHQGANQRNVRYASLLQFLPLIIIFLSSFAFNFSREEPLYSLTYQHKYPHERQTPNLKINYYVDSNFQATYGSKQSKINQIEHEIEINHIHKLQQSCEYQKNTKRRYEMQAQYYSGSDRMIILNKANSVDLSPCHLLQQIRVQNPHLVGYIYQK